MIVVTLWQRWDVAGDREPAWVSWQCAAGVATQAGPDVGYKPRNEQQNRALTGAQLCRFAAPWPPSPRATQMHAT
jgi:hypothetical protein